MDFKKLRKFTVRDRLKSLQPLLETVDCLLVVNGDDSLNSQLHFMFFNWLLFGKSGVEELRESSIPEGFSETFLVLKKNKVFCFSLNETKAFIKESFALVPNTELYFSSKEDSVVQL